MEQQPKKYFDVQTFRDVKDKKFTFVISARHILKERILAALRHRLEKAKDERSKCAGLNLLAYQEAKGRVAAYEEIIAHIESGNFDKGEE